MKEITHEQSMPYDLNIYVQKLEESRKRVSNIFTRLQTIHDKMSQLQRNIARETFKQKQSIVKDSQQIN